MNETDRPTVTIEVAISAPLDTVISSSSRRDAAAALYYKIINDQQEMK